MYVWTGVGMRKETGGGAEETTMGIEKRARGETGSIYRGYPCKVDMEIRGRFPIQTHLDSQQSTP